MAVKVIDASALVAIVFVEDVADQIDSQLQEADLVAPVLLQFELTNACLTKLRRNPDQRDALLEQFRAHVALSIEMRGVDYWETLELAEQLGLSAYDASYLWLARELNAELVTLDQRLARAAAAILGQA